MACHAGIGPLVIYSFTLGKTRNGAGACLPPPPVGTYSCNTVVELLPGACRPCSRTAWCRFAPWHYASFVLSAVSHVWSHKEIANYSLKTGNFHKGVVYYGLGVVIDLVVCVGCE